ncbi:uncharacterized protein [Dendrobates tinctorius]|uniref:uncharacterized protein n=1 Tax=Dendrobates tinctorius TaxID=92724 RepID=UPI003CC9A88C
MKDGVDFESKKTPNDADYDSDETMVDDSIQGSDEDEDDSYFKRLFIIDDYCPTSDVGLCPTNKNVGKQSPEIHLISTFFPAAQANSMETASEQVSDTLLEEEASQSLLRNWKRLPPHKDICPSPPSMELEGLCEDAQQLFDSCELEDNNVDESQDTSLQSAIVLMDVSYPIKEIVSSNNIDTLNIQEKKHNVNDTSEDGGAHIVREKSRSFIDEINIEDLLKMSGEMVSFTELINDLSFLEMPEDDNGELNSTLLAEINSMLPSQSLQSAGEGCSMEGEHPDREGNTDCSNKQQLPGPDESVKHKREDYGLSIQKTDKFIDKGNDLGRELREYFKTYRGTAHEGIVWKAMKAFFRGLCIKEISKIQTSSTKQKDQLAFRELEEAEEALIHDQSTRAQERLKKAQARVNALSLRAAERKKMFRTMQYFEEGERAGHLLALVAAAQRDSAYIIDLKGEDGKEVTDTWGLLEVMADFYTNLYGSQVQPTDTEIDEVLVRAGLPKLSMESQNFLDES